MSEERKKKGGKKTDAEKIDKIISRHILFSMTAGAIPIPLVDIAAVTAIQVDMIKQIAEVYNVPFDNDKGKSIVTSLAGASLAHMGGATAGRIGASVLKSIPLVGTFLGVSTQVVLSGATTYAIGKAFDLHFSKDGTFVDFKAEEIKKSFDEFFQKGKEIVEKLKKDTKDEDALDTIEKLNKLKESGAITKKEFEDAKKKILEKITK